jgi:hypothetical protein
MISIQLIADTNVVSYMFRKSTLGAAYADLIDNRPVGLTGHTLAELRAGTVIGRWGERRLGEHNRFNCGRACRASMDESQLAACFCRSFRSVFFAA